MPRAGHYDDDENDGDWDDEDFGARSSLDDDFEREEAAYADAPEFGDTDEWEPDDDEDETLSEREVGRFYLFDPPQETMSNELAGFDPDTFMDRSLRGSGKEAKRHRFGRALFYARFTDCEEFENETDVSPKLWRIRDKLDIYIGQADGDMDGPWRMFLVHRTNHGSRIEEE